MATATPKQIQLAKDIVKDIATGKPKTKKQMLVDVGYAMNTAKSKTKDIFESEGVKGELIKYGFSLEEADTVVFV